MKSLIRIDNTKHDEPKYKTYFYHKLNDLVYEVTTNGTRCSMVIAEENNINPNMRTGSSLPKYITSKL